MFSFAKQTRILPQKSTIIAARNKRATPSRPLHAQSAFTQ